MVVVRSSARRAAYFVLANGRVDAARTLTLRKLLYSQKQIKLEITNKMTNLQFLSLGFFGAFLLVAIWLHSVPAIITVIILMAAAAVFIDALE